MIISLCVLIEIYLYAVAGQENNPNDTIIVKESEFYYLTAKNQLCPGEAYLIKEYDECAVAIADLGLKNEHSNSHGSYSWPAYCSWEDQHRTCEHCIQHPADMYFNYWFKDGVGEARSDLQAVCRKDEFIVKYEMGGKGELCEDETLLIKDETECRAALAQLGLTQRIPITSTDTGHWPAYCSWRPYCEDDEQDHPLPDFHFDEYDKMNGTGHSRADLRPICYKKSRSVGKSSPKNTGDYKPVEAYKVVEDGVCPSEAHLIKSWDECIIAIKALGLQFISASGMSEDEAPAYCSWSETHNIPRNYDELESNMHYNEHLKRGVGFAKEGRDAICFAKPFKLLYEIKDFNEVCDSEDLVITTYAECEKALAELGLTSDHPYMNTPAIAENTPYGCSWIKPTCGSGEWPSTAMGHTWAHPDVIFNAPNSRSGVGEGRTDLRPVCRIKDSDNSWGIVIFFAALMLALIFCIVWLIMDGVIEW